MSAGSRHDEPEQQGPQALYPVEEIKRLYRTISELRAEVEALRRERDNWKAGYDNWKARYDEWRPAANYAQSLSTKGLLPARMLGMHCGDALVAIVESMRAERDALAARLTEIERQEPVTWVLRSTSGSARPTFVTRQSLLSCEQSDRVDAGDDHLDPLYAHPTQAAAPLIRIDAALAAKGE